MDAALRGLLVDELRRVSDVGETASRQALRGLLGIGARDLDALLDALREEGVVSEVVPDGFRLAAEDDAGIVGGEPVAPAVADEVAAELSRPVSRRGVVAYETREGVRPQVTMPRSVADVLDADALGQLLKAGIHTAGPGETFVFQVTP